MLLAFSEIRQALLDFEHEGMEIGHARFLSTGAVSKNISVSNDFPATDGPVHIDALRWFFGPSAQTKPVFPA